MLSDSFIRAWRREIIAVRMLRMNSDDCEPECKPLLQSLIDFSWESVPHAFEIWKHAFWPHALLLIIKWCQTVCWECYLDVFLFALQVTGDWCLYFLQTSIPHGASNSLRNKQELEKTWRGKSASPCHMSSSPQPFCLFLFSRPSKLGSMFTHN